MITISPKRVAVFLTGVIISLTLASLAVNFSAYILGYPRLLGLVRLFNVNAEANLPTWYASITLLACSALLAAIAQTQSKEVNPKSLDWQTLSILFLFLSIDELSSIHELLDEPLRTVFGTAGIFHFAWVIPYGILVIFLGIRFLQFLIQLPAQTRRSFILAGAIYIGGALGMELIGGRYASLYGQNNFTYAILTTFEELLEMLGIAVFIHSLLAYLKRYVEVIPIRISNRPLEAVPEIAQERSRV